MFSPTLQSNHYMSESFRSMRNIIYPSTDPKTYGEYLRRKNNGKNYNKKKDKRK